MSEVEQNKNIFLDLDGIVETRGKPDFVFTIAFFFPAVLVFFPLILLSTKISEGSNLLYQGVGWHVFYLCLCMWILSWVFLKHMTYKIRHPMAYHWAGMIFLSFRTMYFSALLFVPLAGINLYFSLIVVALWLLSESINLYEKRRLSVKDIESFYKKCFRKDITGNLLYNPTKIAWRAISDAHRSKAIRIRNRMEYLGAGFVVVLGPVLFLKSQLYRENFEPRFLILLFVTLSMAMASRHLSTEVAWSKRAINLKRLGVI